MTTPVDHTRSKVEIPASSLHESDSQLDDDDDVVSENSFGSDFGGNATDEGDLSYYTDADIVPDTPPPVYPEDEYPQPTSTLSNMDLKSPPMVLHYTPTMLNQRNLNAEFSGPPMCVVCKLSPAYSKGAVSYPTCGLTCASKMSSANSNVLPRPQTFNGNRSQGASNLIKMCDACHIRPRVQKGGKVYPTCGFTCAAALQKSPRPNNIRTPLDPLISTYKHLSLSDDNPDNYQPPQQPSQGHGRNSHVHHSSHGRARSSGGSTRTQTMTGHHRGPVQIHQSSPPCIVCRVKPCRDRRYVTCGMRCTETLCRRGSSNPRICDYCHRRPKVAGHNQCGKTCRDNASTACLLCRCRPRFGRYHLCGRTCKTIATKWTPLILEARPGHSTYHEVEQRFKRAWKGSGAACPSIKKIYKIIENKSFLLPYDRYKRRVKHEVFRYHGTSRGCTLGSHGNTQLCSSTACAMCSILRTSFKVNLANPAGAFGAGIYSSSSSNKAYSYSNGGTGAIILAKVVLGTVYKVQGWSQATSCPQGYNSVVFDRQNGALNETIVYTDDAIRPVFLIIF